MYSFGTKKRTETVMSLVYCIIDQAAPQTYHKLLQFINVMNFRLVQSLLHFFRNSVINLVQTWTVGSHMSGEMKADVSHSRRLIVSQARCAGALEDNELARDLTHAGQAVAAR